MLHNNAYTLTLVQSFVECNTIVELTENLKQCSKLMCYSVTRLMNIVFALFTALNCESDSNRSQQVETGRNGLHWVIMNHNKSQQVAIER